MLRGTSTPSIMSRSVSARTYGVWNGMGGASSMEDRTAIASPRNDRTTQKCVVTSSRPIRAELTILPSTGLLLRHFVRGRAQSPDALFEDFREYGFRFQELIVSLVTSEAFLPSRGPTAAPMGPQSSRNDENLRVFARAVSREQISHPRDNRLLTRAAPAL